MTKHKVGEPGFFTDDQTSFKTGHAALHIDGSFRLSTFAADAPTLNYAIAPLPAHKDKATYSSFWVNCLTKRATGPRLEAATKWLQYLTTPDVMRQWVEKVGELPALQSVAQGRQVRQGRQARAVPAVAGLRVCHVLRRRSIRPPGRARRRQRGHPERHGPRSGRQGRRRQGPGHARRILGIRQGLSA